MPTTVHLKYCKGVLNCWNEANYTDILSERI